MKRIKRILIRLFGKRYFIFKDNKEVKEIIVYGHRIYILRWIS